jgi:hypothetical protein
MASSQKTSLEQAHVASGYPGTGAQKQSKPPLVPHRTSDSQLTTQVVHEAVMA